MDKKEFEVDENEAVDALVVEENELPETMIVEEHEEEVAAAPLSIVVEVDEDMLKRFLEALRGAPQICANSVSSIKRAMAYFANLQDKIENVVVQDAEKGALSLDNLQTLDGICEAADMTCSQLKQAANRVHIIKQAAKAAKFVYTVDPFLFAIARLCVNAKVSNGKNIEEVFGKCKELYSINEREVLALRQLISDMGYPVHGSHVANDGAFDMIQQYFA